MDIFRVGNIMRFEALYELLVDVEQLADMSRIGEVQIRIVLLNQTPPLTDHRRDVFRFRPKARRIEHHVDLTQHKPGEHFPELVPRRLADQFPAHAIPQRMSNRSASADSTFRLSCIQSSIASTSASIAARRSRNSVFILWGFILSVPIFRAFA